MPRSWGHWRGQAVDWKVGGPRVPGSPLTREAMVAAALHVERGQVQPDPHDLLKQPLPDLIHRDLVLAVQLRRGGHEAAQDGVDATWSKRSKPEEGPGSVSELRLQRARPGGSGGER